MSRFLKRMQVSVIRLGVDEVSWARGEEIYMANCASCQGDGAWEMVRLLKQSI